MEIRTERSTLAEELGWVSRVIPQKPAVQILQGLLIETIGPDRVRLFATDQYMTTSTEIDTEVLADGSVVLPGKLLADIAGSLPQKPVTMKLDGPKTALSCGRSDFLLPVLPLDDYPKRPNQPDPIGTIPGDDFSSAIAQVAFAAAKDESFPALCGVQIKCADDQVTMLATDRYRLAVKKVPWTGQPRDSFVLRAKNLADVAKPVSPSPVELSLDPGTTLFGVTAGSRRTTMPMLEVSYPDVERLIPTAATTTVETDIGEMMDAVRRVRLVQERPDQSITLRFADGAITLLAAGGPDARATEEVEGKLEGNAIDAGFNPEYLLEALGALAGTIARFRLTDPPRPVLLDSPEDDSYSHVLMPIRLGS